MPLVIKPRTLAVLTKVERRTGGARYIATVMAAFDLADSRRLDGEQALWLMAAQALPPGGALDTGMPKPRAELLIGGRIQAPDRGGLLLEAEVAGLTKRLAVFGDRWWAAGPNGYAATAPQPLTDLLLGPELAFGGPGHRLNPAGRGFGAAGRIGGGQAVALPNVEDPAALLHRPEDEPAPAVFGPLDVMHPERARLAGTYDQAWVEHVAPALADDIHPDFFMTAPPDQRFGDYLAGGEPYRLRNFSAGHPELSGHLPALRPRAFVGRGAAWVEMTLRLDTLWLFAGARRGLLAWHGVVPVADLEGRDVTDLMLAYEHQSDPPRPLEHYAEVRRLRTDPATAPRYAFSDGQLSPAPEPEEAARRAEARRTQATRGAARTAEASDFLMNRRLDALAVPAAVRPPPAVPDPDPLLLPTAEDLADGDFDLGAVLDALEARTRAAHDSLLAQAGQGQAVLGAMDALKRPGAGAAEVDALLASLAPLGGPDMAGALDAAAPAAGPLPELDGAPLPPALDAALAAAGAAGDWRTLLADALQGTDDAAQVAAARARFLALPEASPFAPARAAMASARGIEVPPLPPPPEDDPATAAAAPPADPLAALLVNLAAGPDLPPEQAAALGRQVAEADGRLSAALPALAVPPGRSALDTLLADLAPAAPAPAAADPQARMAQARQDMAEADAVLEAAAPRLAAGLAELRLNAPQAAYPQETFSPHVARSFGDIVLAEIRAGRDLAGRDLAGANLAGADLSGLDFTGAFLEKANLANARLAGAILVEAALSEARLDHTDFSGADLTRANLCGVDAPAVCFDGARLDGTRLIHARMPGARMRGAMLRGVQALEVVLDGADLGAARLDEVLVLKGSLAGASLARAQLRQCLFLQADLTGVDLSGAFLDRCALTAVQARGLKAAEADLRGSTFIGGALLAGADFSGALASDCSFFGADLTGARFPHASLDRAVFGEARLAGADFRLASLRRAFLDAAVLTDADFIGAQAMEAQFHRADLARATLRGANLFGADLSDAALAGADLTGANLFNTVLALETTHA